MNSTYVQQSATVQKVADSKVASILDESAHNESLQRKADMANNAAQRAEAPRPNNTGMPDNLKLGIESLSGFSMDDVRVHYNSSKPATVQALAYTQGTDIHVAPGQEKHLPHEAWHVAQQMAGRVSPTTNINGMPVNDNASLEHEADVMGEKSVQMKQYNENGQMIAVNNCVTQRVTGDKPNSQSAIDLYSFLEATGITIFDEYRNNEEKEIILPSIDKLTGAKKEFLNGAHIITTQTYGQMKSKFGEFNQVKTHGALSSHWNNNENGTLSGEGMVLIYGKENSFKFGPVIPDDGNIPVGDLDKYDNCPCYVQLEGAGNSSKIEHGLNFLKYKFTDYNIGPGSESEYSEANDNPSILTKGFRNYALPSVIGLGLSGVLDGSLSTMSGGLLGALGGSAGALSGVLLGALGGSLSTLIGGWLSTLGGGLGTMGGGLLGALCFLGGASSFGIPGVLGGWLGRGLGYGLNKLGDLLPGALGDDLSKLGGWLPGVLDGRLGKALGIGLPSALGGWLGASGGDLSRILVPLGGALSGIFLKDLVKSPQRLVLDQNGTEMYIDHKTGERTYTDSEGNQLHIDFKGIFTYTNKYGVKLNEDECPKLKKIAQSLKNNTLQPTEKGEENHPKSE